MRTLVVFVLLPFSQGLSAADSLDALLESVREKHSLPALSAAVFSGGELRSMGATGVRRTGVKTPVTHKDVWHLGSCTKAMTATLMARLVQKGDLEWDLTLSQAFKRLRGKMHDDYRAVTLAQLLANRGGTPGSLVEDEKLWRQLRAMTRSGREARRQLAVSILTRPPEKNPGTYVYSNAGFAIAAAAAEAVTGKSWETLMQREVFKPLRIRSAGFGPPGSLRKLTAPQGHESVNGKWKPKPPTVDADNPTAIFPAGGVHMTLEDWGRFAALHLKIARAEKNEFLEETIGRRLQTPVEGTYALGWGTVADGGGGPPILSHAGSNTLWYAVIWIVPSRNLTVLVVTNCGGPEAKDACGEVAKTLLEKQ